MIITKCIAGHTIFSASFVPAFKQNVVTGPQAELLCEYGAGLQLTRHTSYHKMVLYALDGFYVEVFFNRKTEALLFLKPFNGMKNIDTASHDRY